MNDNYVLLAELQTVVHWCNIRIDIEELTPNQIHEILIERDLLSTIFWDLTNDMIKPH